MQYKPSEGAYGCRVMPILYVAAGLLAAIGAVGAAAASIGFMRVRIWWGAVFLALLALMLTGAAISFGQRALL